ncbi:MAG: recombination protein RecR [SAR324 cluster bacterium]|nr:recombination protein RecR [SAR324 cluster bacterium]
MLSQLIAELAKFPAIGHKSAQKLAFASLDNNQQIAKNLSNLFASAIENLSYCLTCFALIENKYCAICEDKTRDRSRLCVVEDTQSIFLIEDSKAFNGLYHVLGGVISPIKGILPENLNINSLLSRLKDLDLEEIIIATNPNIEGDATAYYLSQQLQTSFDDLKVTKLSEGIPNEGYIEYADSLTLNDAFTKRTKIS